MKKLKELIKSPHIQIALATGLSIIVMAYVSKRILPEPIGYLPLAIPPFIMTVYEYVLQRHKDARICTTWYWIAAIFIATALIILFNFV
jgi:predicted histidine transporter YuiF (NhaC family)